jgi:hypothetical protein
MDSVYGVCSNPIANCNISFLEKLETDLRVVKLWRSTVKGTD